jgi:carboxyl-terminal processing protease
MDKYGEDTEPSALPFDMINKSTYTTVGSFTSVLPQLTKLHNDRMSTNANYKYMQDDIADYKKRDAEKSITLKRGRPEKTTRYGRSKNCLNVITLNVLLLALPALKKGETAKPEDKKLLGAKKNNDLDFLKVEAGQILTDYISLDNKVTGVVHP